jgi:hypothetical protein
VVAVLGGDEFAHQSADRGRGARTATDCRELA